MESIKNFNDFLVEKVNNNPKINFDIKYGLIVLNRQDLEDGIYEILHFVGYEKEPTDLDIKSLQEELNTDESFGLINLGDNMIIIRASEETVEEYRKIVNPDKLLEGKVEDVEHLGHGLRFRNENFPGYNQPKKYEGKGKHRYRVLAKEGDKVKVINFGKKDQSGKEKITRLSKKYWERYWR